MSINQWRYVEYTDDGCAIYQCLKCYEQWEARSSPGWFDEKQVYHPSWKFCPHCGTQWGGMRCPEPDGFDDSQFGPRRRKIKDAMRASYEKNDYKYPSSEPPFWWVVEIREQWLAFRPADPNAPWKQEFKIRGLKYPIRKILELVRNHRKEVVDARVPRASYVDDEGDDQSVDMNKWLVEVRLVKAKTANVHELNSAWLEDSLLSV